MSPTAMPAERPAPGGHLPYVAALLAVGALVWANALGCGFVFDDLPSITQNRDIRDLAGYLPGGHGYLGRPNRWVGYLTFALNHRAGGFAPAGYHAVNAAIHLAAGLLVYALAVLTFRAPRLRASRLAPSARAVGFVAAALFVCHPLQTQAVTYVVQRLTSLATLFYLAAVVLYALARLAPAGAGWRRGIAFAGALASAALASKTKEIAFTLPATLALYELAFLQGRVRRRVLALAPFAVVALSIPATAFGPVARSEGLLSDIGTATAVQTTLGRLDYLATETTVVVKYLRLLLLPVGQNVDHDQAIHRSFLDGPVLASTALLAALVALALRAVWRRDDRAGASGPDPAVALAGFGVLWFLVTLSVESSLIPIVDLVNEHRVYLPSAGFFLAAAIAICGAAHRIAPARGRVASVAAGAALAAALGVATHARNEVWESPLTLWADAARKSPAKPRPLNNLGVALDDAGRHAEAAEAYRAALRADPGHAEAYYNLGRQGLEAGAPLDGTIALFERAIALRPVYPDAYANLAAALVQARRYAEAVRVLEGAGALLRESPEAQFNLGVARAMLGDAAGARRQVEALAKLSPALAARLEAFADQRPPSSEP